MQKTNLIFFKKRKKLRNPITHHKPSTQTTKNFFKLITKKRKKRKQTHSCHVNQRERDQAKSGRDGIGGEDSEIDTVIASDGTKRCWRTFIHLKPHRFWLLLHCHSSVDLGSTTATFSPRIHNLQSRRTRTASLLVSESSSST